MSAQDHYLGMYEFVNVQERGQQQQTAYISQRRRATPYPHAMEYLCHFGNGIARWIKGDKIKKLPRRVESKMPHKNWKVA